MLRYCTRRSFQLSFLTLLFSASSSVFAAGFMLQEQNAVQTGDFGAGGAAIAEDASTAWFNPAGLTRLDKPQLVLAANQIIFQTSYSGLVSYSNTTPGLGTTSDAGPENQYVSNVRGGTSNFVPVMHLAYPLSPNVVGGFSITTPFGLSTDYDSSTFVRYANTKTKLQTIDLSPSLGLKFNDKFSGGVGLDVQRLIATFDNYAAINPAPSSATQANFPTLADADTLSHNSASDWALGWHTGILFQPSNETRYGLAYHSKVVHHANGHSVFTGPLADPNSEINILTGQPLGTGSYNSNHAQATLYLPASTMLSAYHDMNNRWAMMGSVVYTQWNILKSINLQNVMASQVDNDADQITPKIINVSVPQNFHNTWRASVGTNYKANEYWLLRTGVGYDESPVNNRDRNLRLPDGDRYAVAVGARYQATKSIKIDGGWTHEFIKPARLNNTATQDVQSVYVAGKSYSHADVLGLQLTWNFA